MLKSNKFTNLEQMPLNGSQVTSTIQKNLLMESSKTNYENDWTTDNLTNDKRLFNCDNRQIKTHQ